MSISFKSLNAVVSTGPGAVHDLEDVKVDHALQVSVTGSPSSWAVTLQGSLDGVNWTNIVSMNESDSDKYNSTGDFPAQYIRANCSDLSGGSSPTLTAWVASA